MYLEKQQLPPLCLKFSVNGKPVVLINDINRDLALRTYIVRALRESASARPMEDYNAFFNSGKLDGSKKISSLKFPNNAVIMLSLKSAQGANKNNWDDNEGFRRTILNKAFYRNSHNNRKI